MKKLILITAFCSIAIPNIAQEIPAGKLGYPLGTYLTVEGVAAKPGFKVNPTCTLSVDTVNGEHLYKPITIVVDNINTKFPQDRRIVIRGYESGKMIGTPPAVIKAAKESGEDIAVSQAHWHFYRFFVLTSWVTPKPEQQSEK